MLGEATLDVSGTFAGEAIRVLILFAAQHKLGNFAKISQNTAGRGITRSISARGSLGPGPTSNFDHLPSPTLISSAH
jgi:hypothetical protein